MNDCRPEIISAAMAGALSLLLLLIMTTLILRVFSEVTSAHVFSSNLRSRIRGDDLRHAQQIEGLPVVAATPVRGPSGVRSSTGGNGGAAGCGSVRRGEIARTGTFTRLREESGSNSRGTQV